MTRRIGNHPAGRKEHHNRSTNTDHNTKQQADSTTCRGSRKSIAKGRAKFWNGPKHVPRWTAACAAPDRGMCRDGPRHAPRRTAACAATDRGMCRDGPRQVPRRTAASAATERGRCISRGQARQIDQAGRGMPKVKSALLYSSHRIFCTDSDNTCVSCFRVSVFHDVSLSMCVSSPAVRLTRSSSYPDPT